MGESGGVKSRVTAIDESDILAAVDSYSSWDYGNFAKNDVDYSKRISAKTGLGLSSLMGGKKLKKPERKRLPSSSSSSSGDSDDEAKKSKKRRVKRMQAEFIIEDLDDFEEEKVERAVEISKMKSKADPVLEGLRNIRNRVESMTNDFDPLQSPGEQLQSDEISSKKVLIKVLISGHVQRYQLLSVKQK